MISCWSKSHPVDSGFPMISYWIKSHPMTSCFPVISHWIKSHPMNSDFLLISCWSKSHSVNSGFPTELNHIPWVHVFLWFLIKLNWIQVLPWFPIEIYHILFTIELNHILRMHYHVPRCHPLPTCLYAQGNSHGTFYLYQASVKKILKDENVITKIPAIVPDDFLPQTVPMSSYICWIKSHIIKSPCGILFIILLY